MSALCRSCRRLVTLPHHPPPAGSQIKGGSSGAGSSTATSRPLRGGSVRWNRSGDPPEGYVGGTSSELAKLYLSRFHKKTIEKFGPAASRADTTVQTSENQFRAIPQFMKDGKYFNGRYYYCRTEKGSRQLVRLRVKPREDHVISGNLSPNCEVSEVIPSVGGRLLALTVSSDEQCHVFILEESSGALLHTIPSGHQCEWGGGRRLYYTRMDPNMRPDSLACLNLSTGATEDIYQSSHPSEVLSVTCTKDKRYTCVNVNTKLTSRVLVLDNVKGGQLALCHDQGTKCYIEHSRNRLISVMGRPDYPNLHLHWSRDLAVTSSDHVIIPNTTEFIPHPGDFGVIHEKGYTITLLDVNDLTKTKGVISCPSDVTLVTPNNNTRSNQTHVNMSVYSLTKPLKTLSVPLSNFKVSRGRLVSRGRYEVWTDHVTEGKVPLTVIAKEDTLTSCSPCLFLCYGCYGEPLTHSLESLPRDLLEAGWKVVLCHVRGGGELGLNWYQQGIGNNKMTSVLDLLNSIRHIQSLNLTAPSLSTLQSQSSGSAVAVTALKQAPGLVRNLVLRLPFLEVRAALSDPALPLCGEEREEWGEAVLDPVYPGELGCRVMVTVAGEDRRAPPWHAASLLSSLPSEEGVYVNLLSGKDHGGFDEDAYEVEKNFMISSEQNGSSLWSRLKSRLF